MAGHQGMQSYTLPVYNAIVLKKHLHFEPPAINKKLTSTAIQLSKDNQKKIML